MSITNDEIGIELNDALGTSETNLYTTDKRQRAINRAVQHLLLKYDISAYRRTVNLAFTNGVASLPSRHLRPLELRDTSMNTTYEQVDYRDFQENPYHTWIYQYNDSTDTEEIHIYPAVTTTLQYTYIQMPDALSGGADTLRLSDWWIPAIAYSAGALLLLNSRNGDHHMAVKSKAQELQSAAWQSERMILVGKEGQRLHSVYEDKNFFRQPIGSTLLATFSSMTWTTITVDTTATVNYGYNVNSTSLVTITLPSTSNVGDIIEIVGQGSGGWKLAQGVGQSIEFGTATTTTGATGYLASTETNDAIRLQCQTVNTTWVVLSSVGNITVA